MAIRQNTNPHHLELHPELQDILMRNGMRATVTGSSNGFQLVVQGHDSPLLYYPISEKQLRALVDWGTNTANKRAYNTLASIVAADFDLPRDFVHARNANGRVAMGLHGNDARADDAPASFRERLPRMDSAQSGRLAHAPDRWTAMVPRRRTDGGRPA